jgi:hypothetical protein
MPVSIEAAEAIRHKKAQYGRFIDTKQWDELERIVALPDAELSFFNPDGSVLTVAKTPFIFPTIGSFTKFFKRFFKDAQTLHMFGPGEFERVAPDEVHSIWSMQDQIVVKNTAGLVEIRGGGFYYETWILKDGEWYLKSLRLERTYQQSSMLAKVIEFIQSTFGVSFF